MKTPLLIALTLATSLSFAQDKNDAATWNLICDQGTCVDRAICDTLVYGFLEGVRV